MNVCHTSVVVTSFPRPVSYTHLDVYKRQPDECVHLAQFLKDYGPVNREQEGEEKKKEDKKGKKQRNNVSRKQMTSKP